MPKILVADDSITVRKVAERLLTEAGLEVALAASGEEALAWLANERPDFVITDVIMPDKSGYDVCNYVRSHAELAGTPVLLISGIVNEDVTRKAESCRADGVLKKPFQGASLQDRVLELLAKKNAPPAAQEEPVQRPVPERETDSFSEPVAEFVATPPPVVSGPTAPKVFRITEEQLQALRQSASRIRELETLLADEQMRSSRTAEQAEMVRKAERRIQELEASLTDQQQRVADLSRQVENLAEVESRNRNLEATVAELRDKSLQDAKPSIMSLGSEDRVPELQMLLKEQQQRLGDLAEQVMRFGEAETKIKALETSLANEQSRADELMQRCADLERAAARATMRLEDTTTLLAQISRLASKTEDH